MVDTISQKGALNLTDHDNCGVRFSVADESPPGGRRNKIIRRMYFSRLWTKCQTRISYDSHFPGVTTQWEIGEIIMWVAKSATQPARSPPPIISSSGRVGRQQIS